MRCRKCHNIMSTVAGSDPRIDSLPGIQYHYCNGCGTSRAITTRPRKVRLPKHQREANMRDEAMAPKHP